MKSVAFRASLLHSRGPEIFEYFDDAILWIEDGRVKRMGPALQLEKELPPGFPVTRFENALVMPGFVDTHTHFAQTGMVASAGWQMLEWLENFTFPTEKTFSDPKVASDGARFFLKQCLRNGTTTALVFATVHKDSTDAFFREAHRLGARMIAGKVLMDRNAPEFLRDTPESAYADSRELALRWHEKGRLLYAVTPRFAPTSSPEQLSQAARLLDEFPTSYLHTHLAENRKEIEWVKRLFPERKGYLDVYEHHKLARERAVFAHCVHLDDGEMSRLARHGSSIAFCPTSNLFLGSGLFRLGAAEKAGVKVGLGTDIGAGTTFSIPRTVAEAYNVAQLGGERLSAAKALYLATLGGARALSLDDKIGNFEVGKEADFVVLDPREPEILRYRIDRATSPEEKIFSFFVLGDDRSVRATYLQGTLAQLD